AYYEIGKRHNRSNVKPISFYRIMESRLKNTPFLILLSALPRLQISIGSKSMDFDPMDICSLGKALNRMRNGVFLSRDSIIRYNVIGFTLILFFLFSIL